ncbi:EamA family transporter [Marmoricola sp. Leaf446]|uniref:EamA family transporter n=1 Tax=Marmoricola sp. Leaf446 TaxID=1736379 RepID=UPI000B0036EC|nr:DMT family transporter [Marmoricola sp. Leaf446]
MALPETLPHASEAARPVGRGRGLAGGGLLVALVSAATFGTSGPFAKSLLETGWTPGSTVFLRIAGAALLLLVPTVRALSGRWHLLRGSWRQVLVYGAMAVALPQLAFFYAVDTLSVGVALLLEYLGLVLVVAWQALVRRRWPALPTLAGVVLAVGGLTLVLDLPSLLRGGEVQISGIGVAWGLLAALGLASYFVMSGVSHDDALPPLALAGSGLVVASVGFGVLGLLGVLPMTFRTDDVELAGAVLPWWVPVLELGAVAAATAYVTGIVAARLLGAKVASFVGLSEVLFAVLFAWLLLGQLPGLVQLAGGLLILAGVVVVRLEEPDAPAAGVAAG